MNTLMHLAGLGALLWLSIYAFDTLAQDMLGVAGIILFVAMLFLTFGAMIDDWAMVTGRYRHSRGDDDGDA